MAPPDWPQFKAKRCLRVDADAKLTHLQIETNSAKEMVSEESDWVSGISVTRSIRRRRQHCGIKKLKKTEEKTGGILSNKGVWGQRCFSLAFKYINPVPSLYKGPLSPSRI